MKTRLPMLIASLVVFGLTGLARQRAVDPTVAALGRQFESATAKANGIQLHYVRGGSGPALILLHGFPQDWREWHRVMPRLAERFTIVAPDLRGIGGSQLTQTGYDAATLAADIHGLVRELGLRDAYVAGHDIGGMVAYAYARLYPDDLRGVMILDVALPGVRPWEEVNRDPRLWHFHFHQTAAVPELLVQGRQAEYFRYGFFDRFARHRERIGDDEVARYAASYAGERLRAAFGFYRAFPDNERFNRERREPIGVPLVLAGGEDAVGRIVPQIAEGTRELGWSHVATEVIRDSGHYVADEQPDAVAGLLDRYAAVAPQSRKE